MPSRILVVDDEPGMQIALREVLQRQGHEIKLAGDGAEALMLLENEAFDLILSDVRMPEVSGLDLLDKIRLRQLKTPVVIMTAYGTIEDAVEAMKKGASDYLLKPFSSDTIESMVQLHLSRKNSGLGEDAETEESPKSNGREIDPIATSPLMLGVLEIAREVADSVATVLIQGESGTGKEVLARYIHQHSGRTDKPFVAVNCAALPEGLLESELFGHEKGAFTGAILSRKGKFEMANHGTLLLDEVSEMPLALQAKLLRVLQEREIDPIGAQKPVSLDVRVIATTNRDLAAYVQDGKFREDLFYRLQVIMLEIPALRNRREDIIHLAEFFVRRHCRVNHRPRKRMGHSLRAWLLEQNWRGNVRELENFLERAVLLCKSDEMTVDNIFLGPRIAPLQPTRNEIPSTISAAPIAITAPLAITSPISDQVGKTHSIFQTGEALTLEQMEKRLILQTLEQVGGNRTRAADLLGVSVRTIRNKLNQYGLAGAEA